jgi:hypothetical protein
MRVKVRRVGQVALMIVTVAICLVVLTAGLALATRTGVWAFESMIENIQEHFWLTSALLVSLCWMLVFRQPERKS